jgi:Ca-activated chloride channel family protein
MCKLGAGTYSHPSGVGAHNVGGRPNLRLGARVFSMDLQHRIRGTREGRHMTTRAHGPLPKVGTPAPFNDGSIRGWKIAIPGGHPLATPAVVNGRVFLGGGFGSYEFYAFDAATGAMLWQYQTTDDGPTSAVVSEDRVVFNTESCELEVLTVEGRLVWKKWLGDPLLSMPAVANGRVFMAYPDSRGDRRHYLACFDLGDGRAIWRQPIAGELITCPILADDQVYLSNLDGTLACFRQQDGRPLWQESRNASSAPAVWRGKCYFSQRAEGMAPPTKPYATQQMEQLAFKVAAMGTPTVPYANTTRTADYLDHEKRRRRSPHYAAQTAHDAGVGFASHKGDAKIEHAMRNLGHAHVSAVWAFQGSKPFLSRGRMFSGLGDTVHCVEPDSHVLFWKRGIRDTKADEELLDSQLTPPVPINGKLFLGTLDGRVLCLSAESGEPLWSVTIGEPVVFQPAVAAGRVYVPTTSGSLFALETGDGADDGWLMWGATACHNGRPQDLG